MSKKQSPSSKKSEHYVPLASVKVVGVGGGGGNAVSRMSNNFIRGVEFVAINTDHQDLDQVDVKRKIYIGKNLTRGLGAGMNPELGRQAAEENRSEIAEALRGADIVFVTAGFGGGTGTGASPIVAEVAKQQGALTIAVVTKPFAFEGAQRQRLAAEGLAKLKDKVDALIVVPNDRIFTIISKDTPILKAFAAIDEILRNALQGIVEVIVNPGIINVDFADMRAIVADAGSAIVGLGIASGPERAVNAVNQAMNSPLLEVNAEGAKGVILAISGNRDLRMTEINEAAKLVSQTADPSARIIFGAYYDRAIKPNQIKITLIATGFNGSNGNGGNSLFTNHFGDKQAQPYFQGGKSDLPKREVGMAGEPLDARDVSAGPVHGAKNMKAPLESEPKKKEEVDAWDIPTFLRKKGR
ncbi:MAG: cell division protein FtsZ [bacterium]|nr:cell division protein FtsZ [bacterium]